MSMGQPTGVLGPGCGVGPWSPVGWSYQNGDGVDGEKGEGR